MTTVTTKKLASDLRSVINDADALLKATAGDAETKRGGVRNRLQESTKAARARVSAIEDAVIAKSRAAAETTDNYVHTNPWPSIGIGAAAGLVIGILIGLTTRHVRTRASP